MNAVVTDQMPWSHLFTVENDRKNRSTNLHQVLLQSRQELYGDFVDESMGITQIKELYRRFKNGRTSVDSDPRSGRLSLTTTPENIERVRLTIVGDRRLTVRKLENDLGIPKTTVW